MKKTVFILVVLLFLTVLDCYSIFHNILLINVFSIHDWNEVWQTMMNGIVATAKSICMIILYVSFGVHIIRKTNFFNFTRLTYEQYKKKRLDKKEQKKQAKKEKLQQKLNEMEKD